MRRLLRHDTTPNFCASSNSLKVKLNEADAKNAGEHFVGDLHGFLLTMTTMGRTAPERTGRYGWVLLRIRAREGTGDGGLRALDQTTHVMSPWTRRVPPRRSIGLHL